MASPKQAPSLPRTGGEGFAAHSLGTVQLAKDHLRANGGGNVLANALKVTAVKLL